MQFSKSITAIKKAWPLLRDGIPWASRGLREEEPQVLVREASPPREGAELLPVEKGMLETEGTVPAVTGRPTWSTCGSPAETMGDRQLPVVCGWLGGGKKKSQLGVWTC